MARTKQQILEEATDIAGAKVFPFSAAVAMFAEKIGVAIELVVEKLCIEIWNDLTKRNPVDTGLSRSRWIIREGEPDLTPVVKVKKTKKGAPDLPPAPDPMPPGGFSGTEIVFITNNVDYVPYLEAGTSPQAPNGFIRIAIATAEAQVETILEQVAAQIN